MSRSRSNAPRSNSEADSEPLRPSDHVDGVPADSPPAGASDQVTPVALGFVGWMRWGWRQLTSMRTALVLLLLLAIAAVPGSIFPQRSADPNGVTQYYTDNPDLAPILDDLQLFDLYGSVWFSSIYLLLFVSLIGCVIPRTKHHWKALRSRPPRTPARLSRLDDHITHDLDAVNADEAQALAQRAAANAATQLRASGYRVERYDGRGAFSVSAERGYLRETGNLVFHVALIGVLISVGLGGGFTYTGQRVIVEGTTFVNALTDYSSFNPGTFVDEENLSPYSLTLDSFDVTYQPVGTNGAGQAGSFSANLTVQQPAQDAEQGSVIVNEPLGVAGDNIYLLGNGYAPTVVVKDSDGNEVYRDSVPFLPQDNNLTSLGVVKVADGMPEQLGLVGFFYPTAQALETGAYASVWPDLVFPLLTLNVYAGDLGIDDGTPRSVYTLDTSSMEQVTGGDTDIESIELMPGESAELPNGWGSVEFIDESPAGVDGYEESVKRFASLSIHHDAAAGWVLLFAVLATSGLLVALFVPRRRMWVKASVVKTVDGAHSVHLEYAGLARGEDPTLAGAVAHVARTHAAGFDSPRSDSAHNAASSASTTTPPTTSHT